MSQHCETRKGSSTAAIQARSPRTSSIAPRTSSPSHWRSPTLDVTLCHQQYSPGATHSPTDPMHGTARLSGTVTPRSNPPGLFAPYHLARPTLIKTKTRRSQKYFLRNFVPVSKTFYVHDANHRLPCHHCRGRSQPNQVLRTDYR